MAGEDRGIERGTRGETVAPPAGHNRGRLAAYERSHAAIQSLTFTEKLTLL